MGHLIRICLMLAVAYGVVVWMAYVFQRKLMYFPLKSKLSLDAVNGMYSEIYTGTSDGIQLLHWYVQKEKSVIVVFHGNAGNIEGRGHKFKFLADQGYSVLLVGYRGYGPNPGSPTEKDLIADSALVIDWLLEQRVYSSKSLVFFGESLGSGVAIALALQYDVKGLIFEGAPPSAIEVGQEVYPFLPVRKILKDTWDSKSRIQNLEGVPKLFIHARKDSVVPFHLGQKLFDKAPKPKKSVWLDRSGHVDNLDFAQKEVLEFLSSLDGVYGSY